MHKQRVITAMILATIVVVAVIFLPVKVFAIVSALFFLIATYEWTGFIKLQRLYLKIAYLILIAFLLWLVYLYIPIFFFFSISILFWIYAFFVVISFQRNRMMGKSTFSRILIGIFVIVPCWMALNVLKSASYGELYLFYLFALVSVTDIAAYYIGKLWGQTALISRVSPKKTREGLYGSIVVAMILAALSLFVLPIIHPMEFLFVSFMTVLMSVVGDLFESTLKRQNNLKDSSQLLPGHGGVLDRIDSLAAAAPCFVFGMMVTHLI